MKLQTLKELIEIEFDRWGTISQFKNEIFRLLEMYNRDMVNNTILPIPPIDNAINDTSTNPYEVKMQQVEWASK